MGLLDAIREKFGQQKRPQFFLGAFGKHPGWADHLDDLGLETEALLAAKHFIYNQGIGGVLDAGQWEAYGKDALEEFDHLMVWLNAGEMLVGRIWSSSDGKGRKLYPMILCAEVDRENAFACLPWTVDLLEQWEAQCRATTEAADVRHIVSDGKAFGAISLSSEEQFESSTLSRQAFAQQIHLTPESEAMARIFYALESNLAAFAPANSDAARLALNMKLAQSRLVPQHFRFRAIGASPEASIQFWAEFLEPYLAPAVPRLFFAPRDREWLDVIIGLPTPKHMICLKATPEVLPLTCSIPYSLDAQLPERAASRFRQFLETGKEYLRSAV